MNGTPLSFPQDLTGWEVERDRDVERGGRKKGAAHDKANQVGNNVVTSCSHVPPALLLCYLHCLQFKRLLMIPSGTCRVVRTTMLEFYYPQ